MNVLTLSRVVAYVVNPNLFVTIIPLSQLIEISELECVSKLGSKPEQADLTKKYNALAMFSANSRQARRNLR